MRIQKLIESKSLTKSAFAAEIGIQDLAWHTFLVVEINQAWIFF